MAKRFAITFIDQIKGLLIEIRLATEIMRNMGCPEKYRKWGAAKKAATMFETGRPKKKE